MTLKQKRQLGLLISQRKDLARRKVATRHAELTGLTTRTIGDMADDASRETLRAKQYALENHDLLAFQHLEEAQDRMDSDAFGTCQVCGEPIEISRLAIIPETSMCYACAVDTEQRSNDYEQPIAT